MSHEMQTDFSPLCNYSLIIIHQEQMQFGKKSSEYGKTHGLQTKKPAEKTAGG